MSGFFRALTGNNHRTRGKRGSSRSRLAERKHGPFGTRRLQMESLEDRQLLSITLPTIANVALPAGTTIFVPLAGSDPGQTVNYAVTVSDYSKLTPVMMPATNKTLEMKVNINGVDQTMDFQLFDNLTPNTAEAYRDVWSIGILQRPADLPQWEGPTTSLGNSGRQRPADRQPSRTDQSTMDEEFNPNLQYTTVGLLAMARRTTPSTSSTEFFITEKAAKTPGRISITTTRCSAYRPRDRA